MIKILFLLFFTVTLAAQDCVECSQAGKPNAFLDALEKISDPTPNMTKVDGMTICRIYPDRNPFNGGWGHFWTELNEDESYGWWANNYFGKEIDFEEVKMILGGVPGELNGQTFFGGSPTQDPFHMDRRDGVVLYDVYISKDRDPHDVIAEIRDFAQSYEAEWSWPIGPNCHVFQNEIIRKFGLHIKKREE